MASYNDKGVKKEVMIHGSVMPYDWASTKTLIAAKREAVNEGCKDFIGSSHTYYLNGKQMSSVKPMHFFRK